MNENTQITDLLDQMDDLILDAIEDNFDGVSSTVNNSTGGMEETLFLEDLNDAVDEFPQSIREKAREMMDLPVSIGGSSRNALRDSLTETINPQTTSPRWTTSGSIPPPSEIFLSPVSDQSVHQDGRITSRMEDIEGDPMGDLGATFGSVHVTDLDVKASAGPMIPHPDQFHTLVPI
jgi:hypothetical protein